MPVVCVNGWCRKPATRWFSWRSAGADTRSEPVCDDHFDELDKVFLADGYMLDDGILVERTFHGGPGMGGGIFAGDHGREIEVEAARVLDGRAGYARDGQPPASWETAIALCGHGGNTRFRVLAHIVDTGTEGATNTEIEDALDLKRPSGSNRRLELEEAGLVMQDPDGRQRPTPTGQPATVYIATPLGVDVAHHLHTIKGPALFGEDHHAN